MLDNERKPKKLGTFTWTQKTKTNQDNKLVLWEKSIIRKTNSLMDAKKLWMWEKVPTMCRYSGGGVRLNEMLM